MENDMKENNVDLVDDKGVPDENKLLRLKKHDSSSGETKSDTSSKHVVQKEKKKSSRLPSPPAELSEGLKKGKDEQSEETQSGKEMARKAEKKLSEHEAALIIQSVYRSFKVRKSQPLTKLRQINEVRKQ
ncbi:BAG domain-containing protein, partial [Tanacetum coccineum]